MRGRVNPELGILVPGLGPRVRSAGLRFAGKIFLGISPVVVV